MATFTSNSPEATLALGAEWGRTARPGWVIGLSGPLGAGKTQLVKGIAVGLGSRARVHSPTFTLLNEYRDGRLPLFHLDLFRLETAEQVRSSGLEDYLTRPPGVAVVEWFERWGVATQAIEGRVRTVEIRVLGEHAREIRYEDPGA